MSDLIPQRHASNLGDFATPAEAAAAIADLRYDALAAIMDALESKLLADADADDGRGRPVLARELRKAALGVGNAARAAHRAWGICAPHMSP